MMPVNVLENRYLIIQGMKNITNPGIRAILEVSGVDHDKVNSQTIGFTISPLINGASRLDKIELAIKLLLSDDYMECLSIVHEMKELNEGRKRTEKELFEKYIQNIDTDSKILIATDEDASKGFNGLIANKIAQEYKRPAIVMRDHGGSLSGSFRTYGDFAMKEFLNIPKIKKFLIYAVGHEFAGGICLKKYNLKLFNKIVNKELENYKFDYSIEYDLKLEAKEINCDMIRDVEQFDYLTGTDFPPANFLISNLFIEKDVQVMGKNKDTVKITCDGVNVIKFKVNEKWGNELEPMDTIEVVGQLKINEWIPNCGNGEAVISPQIFAESYKVC